MNSHANVREAYDVWAETYDVDRNATRDLDAKATRAELRGRRFQSILELGCGTGKNTSFLIGRSKKVLALDFSEKMLATAAAKVKSGRATFAVADLTKKWPCPRAFADLIVCNLVLEHISDLAFVFREARRTLLTGGRFFICELHPFRQYQGKGAGFQRGRRTVRVPAFTHDFSDYFSAASRAGFVLERLREWRGPGDLRKAPRLVSFVFRKT